MIAGYRIHGHAIVSDDDRIATANGAPVPALRDPSDWTRFQTALDEAAVTVLGRRGHEKNPNREGRNRLVLSTTAKGLEHRADAWWWDPAKAPVAHALTEAAPAGGIAAVVGGRRVFDLFLEVGFDAFHLARANGVRIPGGIALFSAVDDGHPADDILARHGLAGGPAEMLGRSGRVSLVVWRRVATARPT